MGIVSRDVARMGYGLGSPTRAASSGADRDAVFYASKVGARPLPEGPAPMTAAQKPSELRNAVHENLRSLGTDHLDVVYLQRMDMQPGLVIEDPRARDCRAAGGDPQPGGTRVGPGALAAVTRHLGYGQPGPPPRERGGGGSAPSCRGAAGARRRGMRRAGVSRRRRASEAGNDCPVAWKPGTSRPRCRRGGSGAANRADQPGFIARGAPMPGSTCVGPLAEGRMSTSKISVGRYTVAHELGMSTTPEKRPSMGAAPSSRYACSLDQPNLAR
ncbi:aldo/keto reductase [Kocuria marina subsp. indica]|nr:aldo/keto reductase [Kocuria indica]